MTAVTRGGILHRYISGMRPFHYAVLTAAAVSYFMLSALIAAPHAFGF